MSTALTIPAVYMTAPLNWDEQVATLLDSAVVEVNDDATYQSSRQDINAAKKLQAALSEHRMSFTRQLDNVKKDVMAQEVQIGKGLTIFIEEVGHMQNGYLKKQAEADRERNEMIKQQGADLRALAKAVDTLRTTALTSINNWTDDKIKVLLGWTPKVPAGVTPYLEPLFWEKWTELKVELIDAAEKKVVFLLAKSTEQVTVKPVTTVHEQIKNDMSVVEVVHKGAKWHYVPTYPTGVASVDILDVFKKFYELGGDMEPHLKKMAEYIGKKTKEKPSIDGIVWQEEVSVTNRA